MCAGVSKSGSPAPRPITSLPSAFRRAARAVTANVGEGLKRWTRRERDKVTGIPVVHQKSSGQLYYGIGARLTTLLARMLCLCFHETAAPIRGSKNCNPARLKPRAD